MCVCFACMNFCSLCARGAGGGQKTASEFPELELQMFVSYHVGVGNRTQVLWESNQSLFGGRVVMVVLRQYLIMKPWLAWRSLCGPG